MKFKYITLIIAVAIALLSCENEDSKMADRFYAQGQYDTAIALYTEYLTLNPEDIKTIYNRGRAYQQLGEHEKAIEDFQHVLKRDPVNVNALLSIAYDYYKRQQDYENTIFYTDKIIATSDGNDDAYVLQGRAYQRLGQIEEALENYNNAIASNEENAEAYLSRGSLYYAVKQNTKACRDFQTASALGSEQAANLRQKYCR